MTKIGNELVDEVERERFERAFAAGCTGGGAESEMEAFIKKEIQAGDAAGVEHYRRAGELLSESLEHFDSAGEWEVWVKRNFGLSYQTAWHYVKLATRERVRLQRDEPD